MEMGLIIQITMNKFLQSHIEQVLGENADLPDNFKKLFRLISDSFDQLIESENKYRSLFDEMADGAYKSTPDGKFIDVNPAFVKMLGYESKEELMSIDIKSKLYSKLQNVTMRFCRIIPRAWQFLDYVKRWFGNLGRRQRSVCN